MNQSQTSDTSTRQTSSLFNEGMFSCSAVRRHNCKEYKNNLQFTIQNNGLFSFSVKCQCTRKELTQQQVELLKTHVNIPPCLCSEQYKQASLFAVNNSQEADYSGTQNTETPMGHEKRKKWQRFG